MWQIARTQPTCLAISGHSHSSIELSTLSHCPAIQESIYEAKDPFPFKHSSLCFWSNQSLPWEIPIKFKLLLKRVGPFYMSYNLVQPTTDLLKHQGFHLVASSGTTKRKQPVRKTALDQQFLDAGNVDANGICFLCGLIKSTPPGSLR